MKPRAARRVRCSAWLGRVVMSVRRANRVMEADDYQARQQWPGLRSQLSQAAFESIGLSCHQSPCESARVECRPESKQRREQSPVRRTALRVASLWRAVRKSLCELRRELGLVSVAYDVKRPNDPSSATRHTGRVDCNQSAMAGFAARGASYCYVVPISSAWLGGIIASKSVLKNIFEAIHIVNVRADALEADLGSKRL